MEIEALREKLRMADPSKDWEVREMPEGTEFEPGIPVVCFQHEGMFICDPFLSDCGGFEADPVRDYGLTEAAAEILRAERLNWKMAP